MKCMREALRYEDTMHDSATTISLEYTHEWIWDGCYIVH